MVIVDEASTLGTRDWGRLQAHVTAAGASFKCQGDKSSSATCKASVKAGAQVHVKGTLTACTTSVASATATQVMVQKD